MSSLASRVLLRLLLIFGVVVLGGVLIWGVAGVGPGRVAPERQARLESPESVRESLASDGYEVLSLERDGSLYRARVRDSDGERVLQVDGASGEVIGMPEVSGPALQLDAVRRLLQDAGYAEIGRIEWTRGSYTTEATGPEGARLRLKLDTYSGEILERVPLDAPAETSE
jgi:hypothetical protein